MTTAADPAGRPKPNALKARSFYGGDRLLLLDQRVARLCAAAARRIRDDHQPVPFEHFPLQHSAFEFADQHELAAELRYHTMQAQCLTSCAVRDCPNHAGRMQCMLGPVKTVPYLTNQLWNSMLLVPHPLLPSVKLASTVCESFNHTTPI